MCASNNQMKKIYLPLILLALVFLGVSPVQGYVYWETVSGIQYWSDIGGGTWQFTNGASTLESDLHTYYASGNKHAVGSYMRTDYMFSQYGFSGHAHIGDYDCSDMSGTDCTLIQMGGQIGSGSNYGYYGSGFSTSYPTRGWYIVKFLDDDLDRVYTVFGISQSSYSPPPVANFQFGPYTGYAPSQITAYDTSTNTPTSWLWTVSPLTGVRYNSTTQSSLMMQFTYPGNYSVTLKATNSGGNNSITKYLNLGTMVIVTPGPIVTITPYPTITGIATLATLPTGLPAVMNRTTYKNDIQVDSYIGNLTAPFINMMDAVAYTIENFAYTLIGYLTIPFAFITSNLLVAENLFVGITQPFINGAHWLLYIIGQAVYALPPGGQELGTLILLGSIFYTVMRGRMGNS